MTIYFINIFKTQAQQFCFYSKVAHYTKLIIRNWCKLNGYVFIIVD